ncbi:YadA-like family protein, partial [Megasphaera sp. UPII 135-E]|uniref:YadA-like family protein n=1 Tax=Megasphaera sp. UPII 135-E TaxID=1000569 RepID=UPI00021A26CB
KYVTATVNDTGLTLGLNENTLNSQIKDQITNNTTVKGKMSAWKLKATGDTAEQEIKDGNTVTFAVAEAGKGLTVSRDGNTIKYGIDGSKIDFSNNDTVKTINGNITTLQSGFTIQDGATSTPGKKVIKAKDTITFKGDSNITAAVGTDGSVTYGLNSALTNMNSITFAAPTPAPGATSKALTIDGTAGTITGLTNTTWNANAITSGRAATEDQLKSLSETVSSNASGSTDYQLVKAGTTTTTDGNGVYTPGTDGKIDLLVQDKKHKGNIETITISDVAKQTELVKVQKKLEEGFTVGEAGEAGKDGKVEVIGKDGSSVVINGKDGSIGLNGTNGQNGLSIRGEKGTEGKPGVDGTTTIKRIVIADPTGQNPHSVATLDDGLRFAGNVGNFYSKLNETVEIVGGVTVGEHEKAEDKLTDENIGVVANKEAGKNGKLDIKLAKNLKDLSSATFTKTVKHGDKEETTSTVINDLGTTVTDKDGNTNQTTAGGTVIQNKDGKERVEITKDGITITDVEDGTLDNPKKKISLTKDGFNNGGNKITNIADGEKDSDAATVGQVNAAKKAAMDTLEAGFDVKAGNVTGTVSLKANAKPTIEFLSAGNGLSVDLLTDATTHTQKVIYRLSDTPVFGEKAVPGEAGKPGKDGKVEVIGKDGSAVVINGKDGSIGLNGTNGQNGLSIRGEKGDEGKPGVDGTTTIKRIVITDSNGQNPHSVATLDDGLKFAGDSGEAIAKKLNETVTISGGVTDETKLTDKNIGVVAKDGKLNVKLAKNLTGLESATFTDKDGNTNKTTAGGTVIQNKDGTEKVEIKKDGITITDAGDGTLANPGKTISLTKDGFDNGGNKITNIANGTADNDAATVAQVNEVKNTVGKDISKLKAGFNIKDEGTGTSNVTLGGDTAPTIEFAGDGNLTSKVEQGKITYSLNNKITIGDKKVTVDGTTGTITGLTNTKWDSKNITSGRAATEDQLNDVQASVQKEIKDIKKLSDKTVTYKDKEKNEIALAGKDGTKITNLKDGDISKDSKDAVNGGQLFAAKNDLRLKEGTVSYDEKTGNGVMTLTQGDGETANKVEVKGLQNTYTASGRYDEKGKKIEFKRNDGKLYNVDMSPLVNGIQQGMNVLQDKVVRAGASSAALASLHPLEYDPDDKWDVAAGVGNYMGANAVAIGAFYRPNENTMFSMGGSFGSGHNMVNAGVSLKVGRGIALISTKAVMAREIIQLKENSVVKDEEIRYLKEKEAKHEEQIQQLMAMVTALQQKK